MSSFYLTHDEQLSLHRGEDIYRVRVWRSRQSDSGTAVVLVGSISGDSPEVNSSLIANLVFSGIMKFRPGRYRWFEIAEFGGRTMYFRVAFQAWGHRDRIRLYRPAYASVEPMGIKTLLGIPYQADLTTWPDSPCVNYPKGDSDRGKTEIVL
jgi:hypothetical protein